MPIETTILVVLLLPFLEISSEPCFFNPLCTCTLSQADIMCLGVPFSFLPDIPTDELYQLSIMKSDLLLLTNDSLKESKISSLRIMHNKLSQVLPKAFKGTEHYLTSLDLSFNRLNEIPSLSIRKLYHLQWLSLHNNDIEEVKTREVANFGCKNTLRSLFLGENHLTQIKDGVFSKLSALTSLDLDNNLITEIEGRPFPPSLVTLTLSHNQLTSVPLYALSNLKNLNWFQIGGNLFHEIPQILPIPVKQMEKLDFSNNLITSLPANLFNSSFNIRDFHLEFNFLKTLNNSTFNGLKLERLSLSNNRLSSCSLDSFLGLESTLRTIDLSFNLFSEVPSCLFNLNQLTHLYLRGNFLKKIKQKDFGRFKEVLQVLDLSSNLLKRIPSEALNSSMNLLRLSLQDNLIYQIDKDDFIWAESLTKLSLASNKIMDLSEDVFSHLKKLRELRLSYNMLTFVDPHFLLPISETIEMLDFSYAFTEHVTLPRIRFEELRRLKWLQLDHNTLSNLTVSPLISLPTLFHFDLEGNRLKTVDGLFPESTHKHVNSLLLSNNDIDVINSGTFTKFPSVTSIILYNNKIKAIREDGFRDMKLLHTIVLAHNQLVYVEDGSFRNLNHLTNVFLQDNFLTVFSLNIFNGSGDSSNPMYLNLSNNDIRELVVSPEYELEDDNLEVRTLDLSHNSISIIPEGFLSPMGESLFNLFLSHNSLSNITYEALADTPLLQVLRLDHNYFTSLFSHVFYGCPSLQIISLSDNYLTEISAQLFSTLQKLRIVDLSGNNLTTLPDDCFTGTKLQQINLSRNSINNFPTNSFRGVKHSLSLVDLSYNLVQSVKGLSQLRALQSLNLSSNAINHLIDGSFFGLDNLLELDLSNNLIGELDPEVFMPLEMLKYLNLKNTNLTHLPILPLKSLRNLKISRNYLYNLSDQSFIHLANLRHLDLSRNYLRDVPRHIWVRIPDLSFLDISHNPVEILTTASFVGLRRLIYLDIRGLHLKFLDSGTLYGLRYLKTLKTGTYASVRTFRLHDLLAKCSSLRRFWIEVEEPMLNHQLQWTFGIKLRELTVTGEKLTKIFPDAFLGLQTHELILRITNTSINTLPDGLLKYLADVRYLTLDIRGNQLSSMKPEVLALSRESCTTFSSTKHIIGGIMLEDNPWICSCEILWLGHWLRRWMRETFRAHILPFDAALHVQSLARKSMCTMPDGKMKIPLIDLRREHLDCQNTTDHPHLSSISFIISILTAWKIFMGR
ncbi:chaoptin-like [Centruroides sculpturatus]|uniref:chaoptin-like n=1 Tax=Centruroides sculpturatus TaxID=218467 RepID=UPI000C6E99FD|nr:chaoptin-like [Centruroides sculpturatus]XP_023241914.1 chaoptin-like [Centruroides sculpturatus]XP_023241915.1 chaoptin-like [Centruroides sculpturatus]